MRHSYKKRLYLQVLSLSAAVLLAVSAQGNAGADTLEPTDSTALDSSIPARTEDGSGQESVSDKPAEGEATDTAGPAASTETDKPTARAAAADSGAESQTGAAAEQDQVQLSDSTVYLSEKAVISDRAAGQASQAGRLTWTLDGQPVSDWKTWNMADGTFSGEPFLRIEERADSGDLQLSLTFDALFGNDLSLRTPNNIRRTYRSFIGSHELVGQSADLGLTIRKTIILRPYEEFHSHEEMLSAIEKSRQEAKTDRLVEIETIGRSAQGREVKLGIISSDQKSIDRYLRDTNPTALRNPAQMLEALRRGELDYKLPVLINNTHADEQPAIDIITGLFHDFATEDRISFETTDADGSGRTVTLDIRRLLEKFIFLFDFTENPDGNVLNTRALANGLDPNRDTGYQANPETRTIAALINKWNPIALYDIHGFVRDFLIEPATPPHDPNFEYDLLADVMLENARHMGRAGVANSSYESYIIPKLDWGDGWDDSFSGYTAVYAMYHGILGHTIEIPEGNQESYKAGYYAVLGGLDYLAQHPDRLMEMRLNFYLRGINKIEDPKAENELVGPNGEIVGRDKKGQTQFFPDYYVIPMGLDKDSDAQEAFNMIDYFRRNGVIVQELTEDTGAYQKGDLVIDMAQAKRGYANHVLYKGSDESKWAAMYAELVVNFPDMKGFKAQAVFEEGLFAGKLGEVTALRAARTSDIDLRAPYYVIANSSESAVKAVNQAIAQGKAVYLTDDGYIVDTATFASLLQDYAIYGDALYRIPQGPRLQALKIYAPPHRYSWAGVDTPAHTALALQQMGFAIVDNPQDADVIVLESSSFDQSLLGLKPTIVVGGPAMQRLERLGVLEGFDAERFSGGSNYEGLMRAVIDDQDPLTSGYARNGLFYSNSGNWIAQAPTDFRILASIAANDFYIAGWWPGHEQLADKIVAIAGSYQNQPLFVYAGNPTNRLHPVHFYRWISNAVFGSQLASLSDYTPAQDPSLPDSSYPAPSQNLLGWQAKEAPVPTRVTLAYTTKDRFQNEQLPQTGSKNSQTFFSLSSLLLASSSGLLLLKKKRG